MCATRNNAHERLRFGFPSAVFISVSAQNTITISQQTVRSLRRGPAEFEAYETQTPILSIATAIQCRRIKSKTCAVPWLALESARASTQLKRSLAFPIMRSISGLTVCSREDQRCATKFYSFSIPTLKTLHETDHMKVHCQLRHLNESYAKINYCT
jgi:hypothetical protein